MATSKIVRSLAKTVAATAFGGPLAGAGAGVNEAIDLVADRLSRHDKDVYAATLRRLEGSLEEFARAERLPRELVDQALDAARDLIARRGPTVTEMVALDLNPERVSGAVLARGERELRLLDEGARELCPRIVHIVYAAVLAEDAALPGLEAAFRSAVLTTLHDLPADVAEAVRLAVETIVANQSTPAAIGPPRLATLVGRLESEFAQRSDPGEPILLTAAEARHITLYVRDPASERAQEPIAFEDAVVAGARILLSGGSGTGKTTSLLHVAIDAARTSVDSATAPIPLYGRLANFDTASGGFDGIVSLIANACGLTPSEVDALWRQEDRPVLFLLDGLNEVNRQYRTACRETLAGEFIAGPHAYVVSSRPVREAEILAHDAKLRTLELRPIDEEDVARYLTTAVSGTVAGRLSSDVRRLVEVPFLLWAYARAESEHPGTAQPRNRGELYGLLIDDSLFGRLGARAGASEYGYELVKKPVLAWLAARMTAAEETRVRRSPELLHDILAHLDDLAADRRIMPSGEGEFMPDPPNAADLLEELVRSGVLRAVGSSSLEFAPHPSVQDYFTAVSLAAAPPDFTVASVPKLDWRSLAQYDSTARSYVMRRPTSAQVDALTILCGITDDASEIVRRLAEIDPIAAADCSTESAYVDDAATAVLRDTYRRLLWAFHPSKRWIGATAAMHARSVGEDIVARLRGLAAADEEPEWAVREAALHALAIIAPSDASKEDWARGWVDDALERFGRVQTASGEVFPSLREARDDMRDAGRWPWEALIEAADSHASISVRRAAQLTIRLRVADEQTKLLAELESGDPADRILAAQVLAAGWSPAAIPALLRARAANDGRVRLAALQALVMMRADEALTELSGGLDSLVDTTLETDLRRGVAALRVLATTGLECSSRALDELINVTKHAPFAEVREYAFTTVLSIPDGRGRLMDPIFHLLQAGQYQRVIDEIGADEPFAPSPNLVLWRAFAFNGIGDKEKAIKDARRFVESAPEPGAGPFAFLASLLQATNQADELAEIRSEAQRRLAPQEVEEFERLLASPG